LVYVIF